MRLVTFHPPTPPGQVDELRKALQEQTQRVEDATALRERMRKSPERAWVSKVAKAMGSGRQPHNSPKSGFLGGGNSNIFYFHPYLGKISNLTSIFFKGVGSRAFGHRFWPCFQVDNPTTPPKSGQVPPKAGEVSIWPFLYILESKSRGVAKRCSFWLFFLGRFSRRGFAKESYNSCCNMLQWHLQCIILVLQNRDLLYKHEK